METKTPTKRAENTEFTKFEQLARKLVSVPKKKIETPEQAKQSKRAKD